MGAKQSINQSNSGSPSFEVGCWFRWSELIDEDEEEEKNEEKKKRRTNTKKYEKTKKEEEEIEREKTFFLFLEKEKNVFSLSLQIPMSFKFCRSGACVEGFSRYHSCLTDRIFYHPQLCISQVPCLATLELCEGS